MADTELKVPKQVHVQSIEVNGEELVDVKGLQWRVTIVEDMFTPFISGNIAFVDAINMFEIIGYQGKEEITIKFKTPEPVADDYLELKAMVVKVSARKKVKEIIQSYTIHFTTKEALKNTVSSFSKTLDGTVSEMVKKVIEEELEGTVDVIEDTHKKQKHKIVVPYWSPMKTINYLTNLACHKDKKVANFFCWQTLGESNPKFNFKSIEEVIQEEHNDSVVGTEGNQYKVQPSNYQKAKDDIIGEMGNVEVYDIRGGIDTMGEILRNTFAGTVIRHDIMTKKWFEQGDKEDPFLEFKYEDYAEEATLLEEEKIPFELPEVDNLCDYDEGQTDLFLLPQGKLLHTDDDDEYYKDKDSAGGWLEKWFLQRQAGLATMQFCRMLVRVPGDSTRMAGNVIYFAVPTMSSHEDPKNDKNLEGKFLVTSVSHQFSRTSYYLTMELIKDSYHEI